MKILSRFEYSNQDLNTPQIHVRNFNTWTSLLSELIEIWAVSYNVDMW